MSKVLKAIMTAVTSTFAAILGTYVSNKISGRRAVRARQQRKRW